jgi:AcrR family transcriptional regulator
MKTVSRISGEKRRASIIEAARRVFIDNGFNGTTTRQLAKAAGVSEGLLFKHFPTKEAIYSAILSSSCEAERSKIRQRLESLKPSTASLVFLVHELVSHLVGLRPDSGDCSFFRLIIRSLMDEGEFTRFAIQGGPAHWVGKVTESIKAAKAAGDMLDKPVKPGLGGWFVHQLLTGIMLHSLPRKTVIDYGVSKKELVKQVAQFCLRGMGLKETAIRRGYKELNKRKT